MNKENVSKQLGIRIHPSLFDKFEIKCKERYKTMSEVVRDFIVKFVEEEGEKVK